MTEAENEAVKRGAEAGWALAEALKDVCSDSIMARIAIMAAIAALELVLVPPASAHCYSVWKYPWAQHCGVRLAVMSEARRQLRPAPAREHGKPPAPVAMAPAPEVVTPVTPPMPDDRDQALDQVRNKLDAMLLQRAGQIPPRLQ